MDSIQPGWNLLCSGIGCIWAAVLLFAYFYPICLSFAGQGAMILLVVEEVIPENSNTISFTDIATMGFKGGI